MNMLIVLIITWAFFVTADNVQISETTKFGYTVQNSEAILQNHDIILMNAGESKPIFIRLNEPTPMRNTMHNDKELSGT